MRERLCFLLAAVCFATAPLAPIAAADGPLVQVSGVSPLGPGCAGPQFGYNFHNSEVEPWVAVNPLDPNHIVGTWQQDRWDNGAAQSLVAGVSLDGGATWTLSVIPGITICSGGVDFERASDPWVSFAPNGDLYHVSLSVSRDDFANAIVVNKSTNGGFTWSAPIEVIRDVTPDAFNDKETLTADPTNASHVYAVWDRLKVPSSERVAGKSFEHSSSYSGPTWFARTVNGGASWEPARAIFDPGTNDQTLGNQIVVLPSGELINLMNLIQNENAKKRRGFNAAVIRSTDKGLTWSKPIVIDRMIPFGVFEPTSGVYVRAGEVIPEIAVDPAGGKLYVVWQDARFTGYDQIAMSMSSDGGFTWSSPIRVNQSPVGVRAFTPSVRVNANGTVGVTYYDFRNNIAAGGAMPGGTDQFLATCDAGCSDPANWYEKRVTPASFDLRFAPWAFGLFVGDYEGLGASGSDFLSFFSMPHGGDQASVFFRRLSPAGPANEIVAGAAVAERVVTPPNVAFGIGGVRPNPAVGGRVRVEFALPTGATARIELLDLAGRRVAGQDVAALGAGRHTVEVASGPRLAAGLYLVRLTQGDRVASMRAVVLD